MKIALVQMRSGISPDENFAQMEPLVRRAASQGALYVQTPEMTNILQRSREGVFSSIALEGDDEFLMRSRDLAKSLNIWLHLGSIGLLEENDSEETVKRAVNRAVIIGPDGKIHSRYDKIHMFDVDLGEGNKWQESSVYRPGNEAVTLNLGHATIGMAICYDVRFGALARAEAQAGANVLTFPAAFTKVSGQAHWHALLRARAIENGAFVLAAAQGGVHEDGRVTFGHSLVYSPWGKLLGEIDHDEPDVLVLELDLEEVDLARRQIPCLSCDRDFQVTSINAS